MDFRLIPFAFFMFVFFWQTGAHLDYPPESPDTIMWKVVPMLCLVWAVCAATMYKVHDQHYRDNVCLGLLFSLLGDACLVYRVSLFLPGLLFFAVAHVFYIRAFRCFPMGGVGGLVSLLVCTLMGFMMMNYLIVGIKDKVMLYFAVVYACVIFTMTWRAMVRVQVHGHAGSWAALIGAILFVLSDFLIALTKWRYSVDNANFYIMISYYFAQVFLAWSAMYHPTSEKVKVN